MIETFLIYYQGSHLEKNLHKLTLEVDVVHSPKKI